MSIRTNPMKAVPVLLKRVETTRTKFHERRDQSLDGKLEKLTQELNKIEGVFMRVKKNQDELVDTLHEVDGHLRKLDKKWLDKDMDGICKRIRDCVHKLLPMDAFESDSSDDKSSEIVHSSSHDHSSNQHNNNHLLLPQPVELTGFMQRSRIGHCLCSLSIFPEDAVIKKRLAIYWWIGLGLVDAWKWKLTEEEVGEKEFDIWKLTPEEKGEYVFDKLLEFNMIVPCGNDKSPIVNKFKIHPHTRSYLDSLEKYNAPDLGSDMNWCLVLEHQKVMLGLDSHLWDWADAVYNVSSSYLNFGFQWLNKRYFFLKVLQSGSWQDSPLHHIEVVNEDLFKNLSKQRQLKYLSLRGISRVFEVPPSITKVENLEILDLKACHNLETLPNDISSMKSLTHLILSQCYLLDNMPNGIEKLTQLQVLKGFVLGSSQNLCRISDFGKLVQLRQLSIHIGNEAVIKDGEFESLRRLSKLQHLKISWGVFDKRYSEIQIILPLSLKKLHLQGFPGTKIPEWLKPGNVPEGLNELKITGGKLESMKHDKVKNQWGMKIIHLKYVKNLEVDITNLQMLFPRLRYALIKRIPYLSYTEWSID